MTSSGQGCGVRFTQAGVSLTPNRRVSNATGLCEKTARQSEAKPSRRPLAEEFLQPWGPHVEAGV